MTTHSFLRHPINGIEASGSTIKLREGKAYLPPVYALSRRACSFSRTRLQATTRNGLRAAQLKAAQQQRFQAGRIKIVRDNASSHDAGVWVWDESQNLNTGEKFSAIRIMPETLLRVPPAMDMQADNSKTVVRLVNCIEGVEGEIWSGDALIASRWWPTQPALGDWRLFLRVGKLDPENSEQQNYFMNVPAPKTVPWRDDISVIDRDPEGIARLLAPAHVAIVAAGILALFAAFQAGQFFNHKTSIASLESRLEKATELNEAGFRLKRQAESQLRTLTSKAKLGDPLYALRVITELSTEFDPLETKIVSVEVFEGRFKVRLEVEDADDPTSQAVDVPKIISDLENSPLFSGVFVESTISGVLLVEGELEKSIPPLTLSQIQDLPEPNDGENTKGGDGPAQNPAINQPSTADDGQAQGNDTSLPKPDKSGE